MPSMPPNFTKPEKETESMPAGDKAQAKPKKEKPPADEPVAPDMAADILLEAEGSGSMKPLEDALSELGRGDLMPADVMAAAQNHTELDKMSVDELAKALKENPDLLDELDIQTAEEEPSGPYKNMSFDAAIRDMSTEKEEE